MRKALSNREERRTADTPHRRKNSRERKERKSKGEVYAGELRVGWVQEGSDGKYIVNDWETTTGRKKSGTFKQEGTKCKFPLQQETWDVPRVELGAAAERYA